MNVLCLTRPVNIDLSHLLTITQFDATLKKTGLWVPTRILEMEAFLRIISYTDSRVNFNFLISTSIGVYFPKRNLSFRISWFAGNGRRLWLKERDKHEITVPFIWHYQIARIWGTKIVYILVWNFFCFV